MSKRDNKIEKHDLLGEKYVRCDQISGPYALIGNSLTITAEKMLYDWQRFKFFCLSTLFKIFYIEILMKKSVQLILIVLC